MLNPPLSLPLPWTIDWKQTWERAKSKRRRPRKKPPNQKSLLAGIAMLLTGLGHLFTSSDSMVVASLCFSVVWFIAAVVFFITGFAGWFQEFGIFGCFLLVFRDFLDVFYLKELANFVNLLAIIVGIVVLVGIWLSKP